MIWARSRKGPSREAKVRASPSKAKDKTTMCSKKKKKRRKEVTAQIVVVNQKPHP